MSKQTENTSIWEKIIAEGLVWACIAFSASWSIFILLCFLKGVHVFDSDLMHNFYYSFSLVGTTGDYLISKNVISRENWLGVLLICDATPWMIVGFLFGSCRGLLFEPSAMAQKDGCLKTSFFVVLAALVGIMLVLVF